MWAGAEESQSPSIRGLECSETLWQSQRKQTVNVLIPWLGPRFGGSTLLSMGSVGASTSAPTRFRAACEGARHAEQKQVDFRGRTRRPAHADRHGHASRPGGGGIERWCQDHAARRLDHITAAVPAADVFVATIIPLASSSSEAAARTFNAAVPGIVQGKVNSGKRVHLVDMHAALTTADLTDGIHPTADGYDKMAATWYAAVRSVPGSIGDPGGTGARLVSAASGRCLDVPNSNAANGTQPVIWDCNGGANQKWNLRG